jgi:hexosaminidase
MKTLKYLLISIIFLFFSCKSQSPQKDLNLEISWKQVSNFIQPFNQCEARFTFKNNGQTTLGDSLWVIYFNIAPRNILKHPTPQPATISHINGDWYKLSPNKGFKLSPNQSIDIAYRHTEGVIKETDAPLGMYLVWYDNQGNEKEIINLGDAKVLPFKTKEQFLRGKSDLFLEASALHDYNKNSELSSLPISDHLPIIPEPENYKLLNGSFIINESTQIICPKELIKKANFLHLKFKEINGLNLKVEDKATINNAIYLEINEKINPNPEAYQLNISENKIQIIGASEAGLFYGIQSLIALIPLESWQTQAKKIIVPCVEVSDSPRFGFRGMHLDVGRNFQTKQTILKLLDVLAFYKINQFLFYTTEDEGWRLEIDGLPELTEIGAKREHLAGKESAGLHPAYGSGPTAYQKNTHGSGYYSKSDFVEILKYAAERHIRVIPEVNFPGHARAAIKAMEARYEKLLKQGKKKEAEEFRLIDPNDQSKFVSAQGYKDNVVDVSLPSTYHFYEKVMDEIAEMYQEAGLKMDIIHIGGDEVADGAWEGNEATKLLFKNNPSMETFKNFHPYFIEKLLPLLKKRNLQVHGWEEAAQRYKKDGTYEINKAFSQDLVPYIWNNVYQPDLGYKIANAGYKVVLCNVSNFYFDLAYNNHPQEPGLYWAGFVDTKDAFLFDPYNMFNTTFRMPMGEPMNFNNMEKLKPEARKNILGIEAQLWSETVKGEKMLEYYTLPKLVGFAQSAWVKKRPWEEVENADQRELIMKQNWNVFANSLATKDLPRLSYLANGYNYRIPPPGAKIENGILKANVALPGLKIYYSTDGTEPNINSKLYQNEIPVKGKVKMKCFDAAGKGSSVIEVF